jgi:hypothetical protein
MDGHADLDAADRDALERCMEIAKRDRAEQLEGKLLQGDPWIEVAEFASYSCQIHALNLKPWQSPPCTEDEDDPAPRNRAAQTLLRRMLRAGISRFDPDPLRALAGAKRTSLPHRKMSACDP